ncbi:MAG: septum formation inhibitor Maf [Calditrichae bacterium]|nr:septum formation inhibitor Maf [Calditrichota bacterium]MCB9059096.1 septum formation inhibitor Maf [Calditrichia bacterium]
MIFSLITNLEHLDIILASTSPRRFELLDSTGLKFKVIPSGFDESKIIIKNPEEYVKEAALQKGLEVAKNHPGHLVISADTIVVLDRQILGKPNHEDHAIEMLKQLSGKKHTVLTAFGLFLLRFDKQVVETVSTDVTMQFLSDELIEAYVNTGEPLDKAGAYAIQGQGAMLIEKINGSYSNVVGFPLAEFFQTLDNFLKGLKIKH